jgi:hypothetical protein
MSNSNEQNVEKCKAFKSVIAVKTTRLIDQLFRTSEFKKVRVFSDQFVDRLIIDSVSEMIKVAIADNRKNKTQTFDVDVEEALLAQLRSTPIANAENNQDVNVREIRSSQDLNCDIQTAEAEIADLLAIS